MRDLRDISLTEALHFHGVLDAYEDAELRAQQKAREDADR